MNNTNSKLDGGKKHVLRLIDKDKGADGWTSVSAQLYSALSKAMPPELATFELVGTNGGGRARLTDEGNAILRAMEWL